MPLARFRGVVGLAPCALEVVKLWLREDMFEFDSARDRVLDRAVACIERANGVAALAFTAAIDDSKRFRRSRDIGAYLGLVPRRYQSGEVDYTRSISKCGDRRVRTPLYEAANC